jgi:hypothetical protein
MLKDQATRHHRKVADKAYDTLMNEFAPREDVDSGGGGGDGGGGGGGSGVRGAVGSGGGGGGGDLAIR